MSIEFTFKVLPLFVGTTKTSGTKYRLWNPSAPSLKRESAWMIHCGPNSTRISLLLKLRILFRPLHMTPRIREKFKNLNWGLKTVSAGMLHCRLGWMSCSRESAESVETVQMECRFHLQKFRDWNRFCGVLVFFICIGNRTTSGTIRDW